MPIFSFVLTMRAPPGASGNEVLTNACRRLAAAGTPLLPTGVPGIGVARCEPIGDALGPTPADDGDEDEDDEEEELRRFEAELGVEADNLADVERAERGVGR